MTKEQKNERKNEAHTPRPPKKKAHSPVASAEAKKAIASAKKKKVSAAMQKADAPKEKVQAPHHKRVGKKGHTAQRAAERLATQETARAQEKFEKTPEKRVRAEGAYVSHVRPEKSHRRTKGEKKPLGALRVMCLGGLMEIGKNMTVIEYENDIVVVDCGLAFPDEELPGIDLVIPDVSYLIQNANRVRGIFITHGHEDHIGAIPYVLSQLRTPIYGTRLSLGIIEGKLEEHALPYRPELRTVEAGDTVQAGNLRVEFIHVNHSIADACALAIHTPLGVVYHSGDFKLDVSPIDGQIMDLTRIGQLGKEGVKLLLCESTNAERAGFTPSERTVGSSLERIFQQYEDRRLIIATFSSNVHRVQQVINASHKHGRKVAILGRSMINVIGAASELGYMDLPDGVLIDISDIKRYKPEQLTLITTGSQGEPMSALYRIAFSEHKEVKLSSNDVVILSAHAIPGNEKLIGKIVNALVHSGVKVVNDAVEDVHVSGHACREEIKLLMALLRPEYYMPIHGEARHLYAGKEIGEFMGIPPSNIFIPDIGKVLKITEEKAAFAETVPSGVVLVDGAGVGDIGSVVLRDRKHLSEDGLVVVVATVNLADSMIISGPDIVSRGFVYVKESEELMTLSRRLAQDTLDSCLRRGMYDFTEIKTKIRDDLAKFIYKKTKRKPMILPIIMDM